MSVCPLRVHKIMKREIHSHSKPTGSWTCFITAIILQPTGSTMHERGNRNWSPWYRSCSLYLKPPYDVVWGEKCTPGPFLQLNIVCLHDCTLKAGQNKLCNHRRSLRDMLLTSRDICVREERMTPTVYLEITVCKLQSCSNKLKHGGMRLQCKKALNVMGTVAARAWINITL